MEIHVIRSGVFKVNSIVVSFDNKKCFVVDPAGCDLSGDSSCITSYLEKHKLECQAIVLTHSHFDHITGIKALKDAFPNVKIAIHENEYDELQNPPGPMGKSVINFFGAMELLDEVSKQANADVKLKDGDSLSVLDFQNSDFFEWKIIHTPGHTPGSICLYNSKENVLISGDTLFSYGGYGRTDMYGGNEVEIQKSLFKLNQIVNKDALVYPGHDEFGFKFK